MIECPNNVALRAERAGGGDGRVYTISYRFTAEDGANTDFDFQVMVPHDSSGSAVIDSGDKGYTVTQDCGSDD